MKISEYDVGYGRPPKHTRWKKGQCGNPNRIHKRTPKPVVEMIDEFFVRDIDIVENGLSRRVSNFEAVLLQLWIKTMAGNKRAMNVLLEYLEFAKSRGPSNHHKVIQRIRDATPEEYSELRGRLQKATPAFAVQAGQPRQSQGPR